MHFLAKRLSVSFSYLCALCAASWLCASAAAVQPVYKMTVETNHPDAVYQQNEPVEFIVRVLKDGTPVSGETLRWQTTKDNFSEISRGSEVLPNGIATLSARLNEPGFINCVATLSSGQKKEPSVAIAAAVAPLSIRPSTPAPADFIDFWRELKTAQSNVPFNLKTTPVATTKTFAATVQTQEIAADSLGGPLTGFLAMPKNAKPGSLPAILLLHGAGVGTSRKWMADERAADGMLALDMNAHGIANDKPRAFYNALKEGQLKGYEQQGQGSRDTIYYKGMYLRVLRGLDILTSMPEWDGRNLIVFGNSQGGAQAIAGAAIDSRVTFVGANIPAMMDLTGFQVNRISGMRRLYRRDEAGKPLPQDIEALRYFDSVNFTPHIQGEVFFTMGFLDTICPPTSVYAAYNQIGTKKGVFHMPSEGHKVSKEALAAALAAMWANIQSNNTQR